MDKPHSDHIENRIRQAAERITTPVTEEAWQKMELLLDKQEKKKRRRGIFWWWYLLLIGLVIGSGLWYYSGKEQETSVKQQQSVTHRPVETSLGDKPVVKIDREPNITLPPAATSNSIISPALRNEVPGTFEPEAKAKPSEKQSHSPLVKHRTPLKKNSATQTAQSQLVSNSSKKGKTFIAKRGRRIRKGQDDPQNAEAQTKTNEATGNNLTATTPIGAATAQNSDLRKAGSDSALAKTGEPDKSDLSDIDSLVLKLAYKKPPKSSVPVNKRGFYITAAYALDATSINKISFKSYKPVYGIGIGYRFTNRLSVQTGIYAGRKAYRAGPGDYKLRPSTYVREIIYINADCYIYEMPLLIRYDVIAKRKYNVYAATGLSTYFFKKENYDFHFLNLTGAYRRMPYNYKNNADYFSVANISVGFEYKVLNRLYVQAEPFIKVPLSGLGEGKVKLTSGGLLAGLRYQPFYRKSKK